jgi:methanogenic corrinoid protein MtbC1
MSLTSDSINLTETPLFQHYVQTLLTGDRPACRRILDKAADCGVGPRQLLLELCWPAQEAIRELYRQNKISLASHHMATRLNRATVDRVCGSLPMEAGRDRKVLVICGDNEPEELGGQITADLFEAAGFEVKFLGGGIPNDEVLHLLGHWRPDLLCLFATMPQDMPATRKLIDYLRDVDSQPNLQIMCCGGIYKRAEGLAEEIGADLFAQDPDDAVGVALASPHRRATVDQQTVGRTRRIRKAEAKKARVTPKSRRPVIEEIGDDGEQREAA